jgi:hypothetical protein
VTIEHLPGSDPSLIPSGGTAPLSGERVTLEEARRRTRYTLLAPSLPGLPNPDEVVLQASPPDAVSLVYRARPGLPAAPALSTGEAPNGLLIMQFPGQFSPLGQAALGKGLAPGSRIEPVAVNGQPGYWIEGELHLLFYRDPEGRTLPQERRLAGNVLLWEQDGLTLRLESALSRDEALRIAASVR